MTTVGSLCVEEHAMYVHRRDAVHLSHEQSLVFVSGGLNKQMITGNRYIKEMSRCAADWTQHIGQPWT